jgi:hypothetical protein
VSIHYVELADYLAIAAEITELDTNTLIRVTKVDLAESALHAPAAGFGETEFYPNFIDKAAVLVVRLAKNHPLPDGNKALRRIEAAYPGRPLKVFSALAEGADRLALGPALNRAGCRLVAVLPLEKYDYLSDFGSSESKDEFLRLLAGADDVVELPAQAEREQAYEAVGDFVCEQADVLLAVWDGNSAQGQGGNDDRGCSGS